MGVPIGAPSYFAAMASLNARLARQSAGDKIDAVWAKREARQKKLNEKRAKSWATRFKSLGVEGSGQ